MSARVAKYLEKIDQLFFKGVTDPSQVLTNLCDDFVQKAKNKPDVDRAPLAQTIYAAGPDSGLDSAFGYIKIFLVHQEKANENPTTDLKHDENFAALLKAFVTCFPQCKDKLPPQVLAKLPTTTSAQAVVPNAPQAVQAPAAKEVAAILKRAESDSTSPQDKIHAFRQLTSALLVRHPTVLLNEEQQLKAMQILGKHFFELGPKKSPYNTAVRFAACDALLKLDEASKAETKAVEEGWRRGAPAKDTKTTTLADKAKAFLNRAKEDVVIVLQGTLDNELKIDQKDDYKVAEAKQQGRLQAFEVAMRSWSLLSGERKDALLESLKNELASNQGRDGRNYSKNLYEVALGLWGMLDDKQKTGLVVSMRNTVNAEMKEAMGLKSEVVASFTGKTLLEKVGLISDEKERRTIVDSIVPVLVSEIKTTDLADKKRACVSLSLLWKHIAPEKKQEIRKELAALTKSTHMSAPSPPTNPVPRTDLLEQGGHVSMTLPLEVVRNLGDFFTEDEKRQVFESEYKALSTYIDSSGSGIRCGQWVTLLPDQIKAESIKTIASKANDGSVSKRVKEANMLALCVCAPQLVSESKDPGFSLQAVNLLRTCIYKEADPLVRQEAYKAMKEVAVQNGQKPEVQLYIHRSIKGDVESTKCRDRAFLVELLKEIDSKKLGALAEQDQKQEVVTKASM